MRIGPGRLVLVVGPSGAGKDTLIAASRARLQDDAVVFPRRVVTRPASANEDHDCLSEAEFRRAARHGAFALAWEAHGLRYGVPAGIDADIAVARTVVCNVSRTVVAAARSRYAMVTVALITAPAEVLASRLSARSRASDGSIADRLARSSEAFAADLVIHNVGAPEAGADLLIAAIRQGHLGFRSS
jgi:ribose 1,5-bisphosphokinase